jgi:hypothetical protein
MLSLAFVVSGWPCCVGPGRVHGRVEVVLEEQLAGMDLLAADVDLEVDVRGCALVPAG